MNRISTKIRVWEILLTALHDNLDMRQKTGYIIIESQTIPTPDGYIPNWCFTSIQLCGSTSGLRYLRKGKGFLPSEHPEYDFQKKKIGRVWHYRIVEKQGFVMLPYVNFEIMDMKENVIRRIPISPIQPKFISETIITESPPLLKGVEPFEKKLHKMRQIPEYYLMKFKSFKKSKLKIRFAGSGV